MKISLLKKYIERKEVFVERKLPNVGTIYVNKGDKVNSFDQLGEASYVKDFEKINYLGNPVKELGDRVYPGDVVATDKRFFFNKKDYTCNISGRVKEIDIKGKIILVEGLFARYNLVSGVTGVVEDVLKNTSVLIKTNALIIKCAAGCGNEVDGELFYISNKDKTVSEKDITEKVAGKVIVADRIENGAIKKAKTLGAQGFILGGCEYSEFKKYWKEGLSILIIEGFGKIPINEHLSNYFSRVTSKFSILRTYDSMLLVPGEENSKLDGSLDNKNLEFETELKDGDMVQVFSIEHYGKSGKVKSVSLDGSIIVSFEGAEVEVSVSNVGLLV